MANPGRLPRCETCQQPCKRRWSRKGVKARFCSAACVPRALRVAGGHKGRRTFAYRVRAEKFRAELQGLEGKRISAEALYEVFTRIYRRGFNSGFRTGQRGQRPAIVEAA